jgi:hypothetical protein
MDKRARCYAISSISEKISAQYRNPFDLGKHQASRL